ncbi:hypothetical protein HanRHA438_Chr02g0047981 [Helianthus annuus]|nr:hypothetical protein HanRHA438_Chr02g0047981 [Helianthus annuus]
MLRPCSATTTTAPPPSSSSTSQTKPPHQNPQNENPKIENPKSIGNEHPKSIKVQRVRSTSCSATPARCEGGVEVQIVCVC